LHEIREASDVKMSAEDVSALFGNIELIYSFNRYIMFEERFLQTRSCSDNETHSFYVDVDDSSGYSLRETADFTFACIF